MGFRVYIGEITKEKYDEYKNITLDEINNFNERKELEIKELYEFGKYVSYENDMKPFYLNEEVHELRNKDTTIMLADKEWLEWVIEHYREKIVTYYDNLLKPFDEYGDKDKPNRSESDFFFSMKRGYDENFDQTYEFDEEVLKDVKFQTALFKTYNHAYDMRTEWTHKFAYDMNPENEKITQSWKFEYGMFELVRIYKTFDWENKVLVYYGY